MGKRKPIIEVFPDEAGGFRFHLIAPNGEIQAPSEPYPTRNHAARGALDFQINACDAVIVHRKATPAKPAVG